MSAKFETKLFFSDGFGPRCACAAVLAEPMHHVK